MKNLISAAMNNKALPNIALGYQSICCILMLFINTAHCKIQQAGWPPDDDPFSDYKATPLEETHQQLTGLSGVQPERKGYDLKLQQPSTRNTIVASSTSSEHPHLQSQSDNLEELRKAVTKTQTINRPVWPELTKPGGLVSSTCVDPLMTGELEAILLNQLLAIDDTTWGSTLRSQVQHLAQSIPIRMNQEAIRDEGIDVDSPFETISGPHPLGAKLMIALEPLELSFQIKAGHIEITSTNSINDGYGVTRIYDVSPLVAPIQEGFQQLIHNIETTIEPDSWLQNGGSSTICSHVVANGQSAVSTLIVVAPNQTHLQLQALLDRLNQLSTGAISSVESSKNRSQSKTGFGALPSNKTLRFDDRVMPRGGGF